MRFLCSALVLHSLNYVPSIRFTVRNMTVNNANIGKDNIFLCVFNHVMDAERLTAVNAFWNWGWTWQGVNINDCQVSHVLLPRVTTSLISILFASSLDWLCVDHDSNIKSGHRR